MSTPVQRSTVSIAVFAFVAAGATSIAACSNGPPSAGQACADLAKAQCAQIAECDPVEMEGTWGNDSSLCASQLAGQCSAQNSYAGSGVTPGSVESCASAVRGSSCAQYGRPLSACLTPAGTLHNGAACTFAAQCSGGECYGGGSGFGSTCGTCTQAPPPPAGACRVDSDCPQGQICEGASASAGGQCYKAVAAGGTCGQVGATYSPCQPGLVCSLDSTGAAGTCIAPPGEGQPCSVYASNTCAAGLLCGAGTCQKPTFVPLGGSCSPAAGGPVPICAGGNCIGGMCVAFATAGSPCGTGGVGSGAPLSASCAYGLSCENGVCTQPTPPNACGPLPDGG